MILPSLKTAVRTDTNALMDRTLYLLVCKSTMMATDAA